ncbi:MAG TPA: VanZ family protein [Draconibacterium sp.]|nr:VanZ family protein [Draconibacterium sp.]
MKILFFWKPLLWLAIICYLLFIPASDLPTGLFFIIPQFDKIVHFSLFFVFCLFMLRPIKRLNLNHYLIAPSISIISSGMLEFIQHTLSNSRSSDLYDFIANSIGVCSAVLFYYLFVSGRKWEKLF